MPVNDYLNELIAEIDGCESLRLHAVDHIVDSSTRSLIYESIILRAARAHENFIESLFISYLTGEETIEGNSIVTFVSPKDRQHARRLISSSIGSRFLDWSEASEVRNRCNIYFEEDSPLYTALSLTSSELSWIKKIRNQAAHDSVESRLAYKNVLQTILSVEPDPLPPAGDFLQMTPNTGRIKDREILAFFLDKLKDFAQTASGRNVS